MKTSMKKITAMILAVVMTVTALPLTVLQVSAAELMDYYPEVDDTRRYTEVLNSNGELRFAYAYAKNDIPCDDDFRIEWSDDFYQYYTVVKVLDGTPNPGPETSGEESGSAISKYIHETSDNYKKAYLDIDQEDLEKYAGKYIKIAIIGYDQDGSYSCRSDTYFYIAEPEAPEILDITVSSDPVSVGEEFTITVETNSSACGVILYCDDMGWIIGDEANKSSSNIYSFTYKFEKTNKTDTNGNDVTNTRKILAYPYDSAGNIVTDSDSMDDYNITVNPAEHEFPAFYVEAAVTTVGNSVTIKWDALTTENGATVYYNLWIDNEIVAEDLTSNSYVLTVAQVEELGVGTFGIMVMASAKQYRMRQSNGGLTIEAKPDVKVYPGDVNGDGKTDATDVIRLKKYLANYDETDPAKQSVVDPVGADVNEDGKINGKDLSALFVKLENGNIEIPDPDPEPDYSTTLPAVKHTYTVNIPLDKADLKATTGRTIYLMPRNGFVELLAYDENGKSVYLKQAGITWDISQSNGVYIFAGNTLTAKKDGFGVFKYTQTINGKKVTKEIEIFVAGVTSYLDMPSSYQFNKHDRQYVSNYLDFSLSDFQDYTLTELGNQVTIEDIDYIAEAAANWELYMKNILGLEAGLNIARYKQTYAAFYKEFGEKIAPEEELNAVSAKMAKLLSGFIEALGDIDDWYGAVEDTWQFFSKEEKSLFKNCIETINNSSKTPAKAKEAYKSLVTLLNKATQHYDDFIKAFVDAPTVQAFLSKNGEIKIKNAINTFCNTKVMKQIFEVLDETSIDNALAGLEMIAYIAYDYTYSVQAMRTVLDILFNYGFDDDNLFHRAFNDLVYEYEHKFVSGLSGFVKNVAYNGVEFLINKAFPLYSVAVFAAGIIGNATTSPEKFDYGIMCVLSTLIQIAMSRECKFSSDETIIIGKLEDQEMLISMYIYSYIYQLRLLKKINVFDSETENRIENAISHIETNYAHFLNYKVS